MALIIAVTVGLFVVYHLAASFQQFRRIRKVKPSTRVCPLCGSSNTMIESRVEGASGSSSGIYHGRVGSTFRSVGGFSTGSHTTSINRSRILKCGDCGYDANFVTVEEVEKAKKFAKIKFRTAVLEFILYALIVFVLYGAGVIKI